MRRPFKAALVGFAGLTLVMATAFTQLPVVGAGGLLHPARHRLVTLRPAACDDATFAGAGIELSGWRCRATGARRGTIVYLHGVLAGRE